MGVEDHEHEVRWAVGYSVQAQHPDPAMPVALSAQTRAAYYGQPPPCGLRRSARAEAELDRLRNELGLNDHRP